MANRDVQMSDYQIDERADALIPVRFRDGRLFLMEATSDLSFPGPERDGHKWLFSGNREQNSYFIALGAGEGIPKGLFPSRPGVDGGWAKLHPVTDKYLAAEIEGWLSQKGDMALQRTDYMARGPDYLEVYHEIRDSTTGRGGAGHVPVEEFRQMVSDVTQGNVRYGPDNFYEEARPVTRSRNVISTEPGTPGYNPLAASRYTGDPRVAAIEATQFRRRPEIAPIRPDATPIRSDASGQPSEGASASTPVPTSSPIRFDENGVVFTDAVRAEGRNARRIMTAEAAAGRNDSAEMDQAQEDFLATLDKMDGREDGAIAKVVVDDVQRRSTSLNAALDSAGIGDLRALMKKQGVREDTSVTLPTVVQASGLQPPVQTPGGVQVASRARGDDEGRSG